MSIQEAKGVLADAEKSLRDLMQRELRAQRYSDLGVLAGMADALARLARGTPTPEPVDKPIPAPFASSLPAMRQQAPAAPAKRGASAKKSPARSYPRFERDDDKLIKVGWSKKAREEYEHRAPRAAVLAFVEHLAAHTAEGKAFAVEDLLPVHDAAGEELPGYQIYLALAWLREVGLVEKKGRDGYVRVTDPLDGSMFDNQWEQIPERR